MKKFQIKPGETGRLPLGRKGEMTAWDFLVREGFQIVEKNFRCNLGEIDVIARDKGNRLLFIEVKTRKHHRFGRPEEAVTVHKCRRLVRLAQFYFKSRGLNTESACFGVISITWSGPQPKIKFIQNAFRVDELNGDYDRADA